MVQVIVRLVTSELSLEFAPRHKQSFGVISLEEISERLILPLMYAEEAGDRLGFELLGSEVG